MANVLDAVTTTDQLGAARATVLFFWASWHEASCPAGQMGQVFVALASAHPSLLFARVEAEAAPELSAKHNIEVVPTFVFLRPDGSVAARVEGANPPEVKRHAEALETASGGVAPPAAASPPSSSSSDAAAAVSASDTEPLDLRLGKLVRAAPVMLFMKGNAAEPKCKFSRECCELLAAEGVAFGSFNILEDDEVRQGLKTFSNWPTYPQLYVNGDLVGGLDILKEMKGGGGDFRAELGLTGAADASAPPPAPAPLEERLKALINQSRVMVFIKGTPDAPECGFSRKIVEILRNEGFEFGSFNILEDNEVRQGLKAFSSWPTYPQLYVGGDLIGGLDIVEELRDAGELAELKKS